MVLLDEKIKRQPYNEITSTICKSRYKAFLFKIFIMKTTQPKTIGFISRQELSQQIGIDYFTIYNREKKLGIFGQRYTDRNIKLIIGFEKKKREIRNDKNKISIIDFFLINNDLTHSEIAKRMGLKWKYVSNVINEWLDNDKCILVDSKINN